MKPETRNDVVAVAQWSGAILGTLTALVALIFAIVAVSTTFDVWRREKAGTARLRQAEQERRILVVQAQAEAEAAVLRARAIETVGAAAQRFPEYREQEFMGAFAEAIQTNRNLQLVYVPTEAAIPIVEAGRRGEGWGK